MKTASAILIVLVVGTVVATSVTPESVLDLIRRKGPRGALDVLWGTEDWAQVTSGVASGASSWLTVAEEIRAGTDAAATSELYDAVAWALPRSPTEVLGLVSRNEADWAIVCSGPPVDFPPGGQAAYYKSAIAAVGGVTDDKLQPAKAACLARLKAAARRATP